MEHKQWKLAIDFGTRDENGCISEKWYWRMYDKSDLAFNDSQYHSHFGGMGWCAQNYCKHLEV